MNLLAFNAIQHPLPPTIQLAPFRRVPPPPRPNVMPLFLVADTSRAPLSDSPSPLRAANWLRLLACHGGTLAQDIHNIITFGAQLGYSGPPTRLTSKNLVSAMEAPEVITQQLNADLNCGRVSLCNTLPHPSSSPLGLVPKSDGGWRRIHHLSHPPGQSVNDGIAPQFGEISYSQRCQLLALVVAAGRGAYLIKRDLKDAFRVVPVAPHWRWLLGFWWMGHFYQENCLPFGLRTAPFLFNLFAEALHWILTHLLFWLLLVHYLDDFIAVIAVGHNQSRQAHMFSRTWDMVTDALGLLRNPSKDAEGTCVECLGIEIDTYDGGPSVAGQALQSRPLGHRCPHHWPPYKAPM